MRQASGAILIAGGAVTLGLADIAATLGGAFGRGSRFFSAGDNAYVGAWALFILGAVLLVADFVIQRKKTEP